MLMGRLDSWKIVWVMFGFFYQTRFWNGKRFGHKIWTLITQGGSPKYPLYSFDQNGKSPLLFLFASGFGATLFRTDPFKLQGNGEKVAFFFNVPSNQVWMKSTRRSTRWQNHLACLSFASGFLTIFVRLYLSLQGLAGIFSYFASGLSQWPLAGVAMR